jgi:hypothetical protein
MLKNYIQQKQHQIAEKQNNFYTSSGINIFLKEPVDNIDIGNVISKIEERMPAHLISEIEMIIFGWFDEFEERSINAFYQDGAIYVSNIQDDEQDLLNDIVHEMAHSIETKYGYEIYSDEKIKDEFSRKRQHLHDITWKMGYKIPSVLFKDTEYNEDFDKLLYQKIGYDNLIQPMTGLFINPYAATSLREYFATAFTDFYLNSDHKFLSKVSPQVYEKILMLHSKESLDNSY